MNSRVLLVAVCVSILSHGGMTMTVDMTIVPGKAGTDVVVATIAIIEQLNVFPDTNRLLRRIAYAETRDGVDIATYRPGYDGGIWQVDELIFLQTQDVDTFPELNPLLTRLQTITSLEWLRLPWNELRRPLFSGIAAIIYLTILPEDIPGTGNVTGQARYWKQYYNSDPQDTEEAFAKAVEEFESIECPVRGLDLVFAFDSSGSVGEFNYTVEKQFAVNITNAFNIGPDATQVGAVAYSGMTFHTIPLDSLTSNQAVRDEIIDIPYLDIVIDGAGTNTSGALRTIRENIFTDEGGARPLQTAFPRVVIVITDGRSNVDRDLTFPSAQALHDDGVVVFAVGIGKLTIGIEELNGIASEPEFATLIGGFNVMELQGIQRVVSDEACRAPLAATIEEDIMVSTQQLGTVSYLQYQLPDEGMTIRLNVAEGRIVLYGSTKIQNPNSALYEIRLETESNEDVFISPADISSNNGVIVMRSRTKRKQSNLTMIYITIEGLHDSNSYTLETTYGDTSTSSGIQHEMCGRVLLSLMSLVAVITLYIH